MNNTSTKICVFYCVNSLTEAEVERLESCPEARITSISLPCSGKADLQYMVKAFEKGADGLAIVTCELGACRHLEGNMRAQKRCDAVSKLLEEVGMGAGRTCVIQYAKEHSDAALNKLTLFCGGIKHISRDCAQATV